MSRVSSESNLRNGGCKSRQLLAAGLLAFVVTGCGVNVHSDSVRGAGYVKVDEVAKHHPLYKQLSQLDDAIAAIQLSASAPHVPLSASQIAAETKRLNAEMQAAQDRANKILGVKRDEYQKKEQQAIAAALSAAGVSGAGAYAAQQMSSTSQAQAQQAAAAAAQDFQAYQQSVVQQDSAAAQAIVKQLQTQAQQKYQAKAEQLQQSENDLALRLGQQDATKRLAIKTQLNNLAMDTDKRKQLEAQLAAIDKDAQTQLSAQHAADMKTLADYRAQIGQETQKQIQTQVAAIQNSTKAKIEERRNEVGKQISGLGPAPLPTNLPPDVQNKIQDIHKQFTLQFQNEAQQAITDYNTTKADLDRQFAALHGADVGATGAAAKELGALEKRRDDLNNEIVNQILHEANRIAKDRGFSIVLGNVDAAAGGYDLTGDLIKDVESLKE